MSESPLGNSVTVALDHGLHWGVYKGFEDPGELLNKVLEAEPNGILASPPFLRRYQDRIAEHNVDTIATLDVLYDSTLPGQHEDAEIHSKVFDVNGVADIADAAKIALVYGRDDPGVLQRNVEFVAKAAEECRDAGIPLIVEPTLWGNRIEDEFDPELTREANRLAFELGAHILKSPYSPESFDDVSRNAPVPVYIAGGPAVDTDREVLEMVRNARSSGARGVMFGRNVWQRDDPAAIINALKAIVHDDASVEEAATHL